MVFHPCQLADSLFFPGSYFTKVADYDKNLAKSDAGFLDAEVNRLKKGAARLNNKIQKTLRKILTEALGKCVTSILRFYLDFIVICRSHIHTKSYVRT